MIKKTFLFFTSLVLCSLSFGALADVVFEIRTTGSDTNGGGFDTSLGGTDYSQQAAAQDNGTNLTVDGVDNTKVTPDAHTPVAADVGNVINISSGASWTLGYYIITAQDGSQWTLDRSPAAVSVASGTWAMGGALGSPGELTDALTTTGQIAYIAGVHTVTTATPGSSGPIDLSASNITIAIIGYNATRGDITTIADRVSGSMPRMDAGAITGITLCHIDSNSSVVPGRGYVLGIEFDGNLGAGNRGLSGNVVISDSALLCIAQDCPGDGFFKVRAIGCLADNSNFNFNDCDGSSHCKGINGVNGFSNMSISNYKCWADGNSLNGFQGGTGGFFNVSSNNGGAGFDRGDHFNSIAYGNTGDGFSIGDSNEIKLIDCISYGNGAFGIDGIGGSFIVNPALGNNTSGDINGVQWAVINPITLTADPFVNAASGDFNLNNTAGGGALLRDTGVESPFVNDTHMEIGALMLEAGGVAAVLRNTAF